MSLNNLIKRSISSFIAIVFFLCTLCFNIVNLIDANAYDITYLTTQAKTIIFLNEGSYTSVNKNDGGSLSIGHLQWHGTRALNLLKTIVNLNASQAKNILGTTLYNEIQSSSNWDTRILTTSEASVLKTLLGTTESHTAQDELADSDVRGYIQTGINYGLTDDLSLIYFADLWNQRPLSAKNIVINAKNGVGSYEAINLEVIHKYALLDSVIGQDYATRRNKTYNFCRNLSNVWYETLTPINLGNSFDALILNKAAWVPVRTLSSTNVVTHPEEWVTNELWRFTRQSDGSYQILNWKNGLCLDADNFGTTDGTNIGSVASNNSTAQKWFIYSVNGGYVLRPSYGELAMDSWGDSTSNGNNVHLWSYQGHDGQVMSIYKDEAAPLGKPAPSAPTVTAVSDTSLSVTWSSTIYTDKYIVYRSTDNSTWTKLGEVTTPGYTDTGLKANTKYYYKYESANRFYTVASSSASGTTKPVPTYTVKYNSNKGTGSMSDSTFTRDQSATLRANAFTRTGYTFAGWNTKADGSGTSYSDKASVKNLAAAGGSITLYAKWNANPITVAYNSNGGTGTMNNQSMKYDQTANLTANAFTRTGYTFAGWNTKADGSGTSYADKASVKNLAASGTITLYAKWTANKYTVKFDGNGADELSLASKEVTYNSTYGELPQPKRDGYNFIGWYTKAEGGNAITPDAKVTITGTQTLYAQWSQEKYLITFNATGGISQAAQKLVTYAENYGVLPTAERTGYTFKGWYLDEACTQQITPDTIVALTANQAVYAKWEIRRYVITFDATGGVAERDNKQVTYGKAYGVLPSATKDGDEFIGWFTEDGTEITSSSIVEIESDTTLYAKWASDEVVGDVNADGVFNVADVVMMQKWLLCAGDLTDWQAGDLCRDERIDVFDLCLMKRVLLEVTG